MQAFFKDIFSSSRKLSLLLIFIFLISVLWRIPGFYAGFYPASIPYTQVMQTANIWSEHHPSDFNFGAVQTYPHPSDQFVHHYDRFLDHRGLNYYVSYPPFVFWVGYAVQLITGPEHLHKGLIAINLCLHFLALYGIFLFFRDYNLKIAFWISCIWLVLPATLDIFHRVFFSEAITTVLFAWLPLLIKSVNKSTVHWTLLPIWVVYSFVLAYNDWLGAAIAASTGLALVLDKWKHWPIVLAGWLAVAVAFICFIWQYSSLGSFSALMDALLFRYVEREHFQQVNAPWLRASLSALWQAFGWALLFLPIFSLLFIQLIRISDQSKRYILWTLAIGLPLIANFYFFFTFSVFHAYNFARWAPWLCVALGWFCIYFPVIKKSLPFIILFLAALNLPIHFERLKAMVWEKDMISTYPDFANKILPDHTIYVQLHGFSNDLPHFFGFKLHRSMDEVFRPEELPVKAYLDGQPQWQFLDVAPGKPVVHFTYKDFPEGWLNRPARCLGEKGKSAILHSFQAMSGQGN
jgi:hypothetical protein